MGRYGLKGMGEREVLHHNLHTVGGAAIDSRHVCCHAGPLNSPLGKGIYTETKYVIAPYGYNVTIPSGYNYTAQMASNTVRYSHFFNAIAAALLHPCGSCMQVCAEPSKS